jgi:hypothetical protein
MSRHLTVPEVARIVGVSRARVYQRISGLAGSWVAGKPLDATPKKSNNRGAREGKQLTISVEDVMTWRAERLEAGAEVGSLPPDLADWEVILPPPQPPIVPVTADDKRQEPAVGIPILTPF